MSRESVQKKGEGVGKRPAVNARKSSAKSAKAARRRERAAAANSQVHIPEPAYGNRTFTRTSGQGISITVQIPPLRRPRLKKDDSVQDQFRHRRIWPLLLVPVALLAVGVAIIGPFGKPAKEGAKPVAAAERTEPEYRPLVPSAEKASATRYDPKRDLVSYSTTFNGAKITVSQQSLPASFSKDPEALKRAADNIKADKRIESSRGPVMVATNEDAGNQMAVFADKDVLVFVFSGSKLEEPAWRAFVELLTAQSWDQVSKAS